MDFRRDLRIVTLSSDIRRGLLDPAPEALAIEVGLLQDVEVDMLRVRRCRGEVGRANADLEPRRGPTGFCLRLHGY